jgi:hypothetical protein
VAISRVPSLCSGQGFGSLAMAISKSGVGQNNFIDKFANYVIKFIFNDIFTIYMCLSECGKRENSDSCP